MKDHFDSIYMAASSSNLGSSYQGIQPSGTSRKSTGTVLGKFLKLGKSKSDANKWSGTYRRGNRKYDDVEDFRLSPSTLTRSERDRKPMGNTKKDVSRSHSWIYGSVKLASDLPFGYGSGQFSPGGGYNFEMGRRHLESQCFCYSTHEPCDVCIAKHTKESGKNLVSSVRKLTWKSLKQVVKKRPSLDSLKRDEIIYTNPDPNPYKANHENGVKIIGKTGSFQEFPMISNSDQTHYMHPINNASGTGNDYFFPVKKNLFSSCSDLYYTPPQVTASVRVRPKQSRETWNFPTEFGPVPNFEETTPPPPNPDRDTLYHSQWDLRGCMPYNVWIQTTGTVKSNGPAASCIRSMSPHGFSSGRQCETPKTHSPSSHCGVSLEKITGGVNSLPNCDGKYKRNENTTSIKNQLSEPKRINQNDSRSLTSFKSSSIQNEVDKRSEIVKRSSILSNDVTAYQLLKAQSKSSGGVISSSMPNGSNEDANNNINHDLQDDIALSESSDDLSDNAVAEDSLRIAGQGICMQPQFNHNKQDSINGFQIPCTDRRPDIGIKVKSVKKQASNNSNFTSNSSNNSFSTALSASMTFNGFNHERHSHAGPVQTKGTPSQNIRSNHTIIEDCNNNSSNNINSISSSTSQVTEPLNKGFISQKSSIPPSSPSRHNSFHNPISFDGTDNGATVSNRMNEAVVSISSSSCTYIHHVPDNHSPTRPDVQQLQKKSENYNILANKDEGGFSNIKVNSTCVTTSINNGITNNENKNGESNTNSSSSGGTKYGALKRRKNRSGSAPNVGKLMQEIIYEEEDVVISNGVANESKDTTTINHSSNSICTSSNDRSSKENNYTVKIVVSQSSATENAKKSILKNKDRRDTYKTGPGCGTLVQSCNGGMDKIFSDINSSITESKDTAEEAMYVMTSKKKVQFDKNETTVYGGDTTDEDSEQGDITINNDDSDLIPGSNLSSNVSAFHEEIVRKAAKIRDSLEAKRKIEEAQVNDKEGVDCSNSLASIGPKDEKIDEPNEGLYDDVNNLQKRDNNNEIKQSPLKSTPPSRTLKNDEKMAKSNVRAPRKEMTEKTVSLGKSSGPKSSILKAPSRSAGGVTGNSEFKEVHSAKNNGSNDANRSLREPHSRASQINSKKGTANPILNPNSLLFNDTTRIRLNQSRPSISETFKINVNQKNSTVGNCKKIIQTARGKRINHSQSFKSLLSSPMRPKEPPPPPPCLKKTDSVPTLALTSTKSLVSNRNPQTNDRMVKSLSVKSSSTSSLSTPSIKNSSHTSHYASAKDLAKSQISLPVGLTTTSNLAAKHMNNKNSVSSTESKKSLPLSKKSATKMTSNSNQITPGNNYKKLAEMKKAVGGKNMDSKTTAINDGRMYQGSRQNLHNAPKNVLLQKTQGENSSNDNSMKVREEGKGVHKNAEVLLPKNDSTCKVRVYSSSDDQSMKENMSILEQMPERNETTSSESRSEIHYAATDLLKDLEKKLSNGKKEILPSAITYSQPIDLLRSGCNQPSPQNDFDEPIYDDVVNSDGRSGSGGEHENNSLMLEPPTRPLPPPPVPPHQNRLISEEMKITPGSTTDGVNGLQNEISMCEDKDTLDEEVDVLYNDISSQINKTDQRAPTHSETLQEKQLQEECNVIYDDTVSIRSTENPPSSADSRSLTKGSANVGENARSNIGNSTFLPIKGIDEKLSGCKESQSEPSDQVSEGRLDLVMEKEEEEDTIMEPIYDDVMSLKSQPIQNKACKDYVGDSTMNVFKKKDVPPSSDSGTETEGDEGPPPPLPTQGPPPLPKVSTELPLLNFPLLENKEKYCHSNSSGKNEGSFKDASHFSKQSDARHLALDLKSETRFESSLNKKFIRTDEVIDSRKIEESNENDNKGRKLSPNVRKESSFSREMASSPSGLKDEEAEEENEQAVLNKTRDLLNELNEKLVKLNLINGSTDYSSYISKVMISSSSESSGVEEDYNSEKNYSLSNSSDASQGSGSSNEDNYTLTKVSKLVNETISMARGKFLESMKVNNGGTTGSNLSCTTIDEFEEPIYEEIHEHHQNSHAINDSSSPIYTESFDAKSIFDGASRNEILYFLESIRDRLSAAESNSSGSQCSSISSTSRSNHGSSREEKTKKSVDIERNDSGIGSETGILSHLRALNANGCTVSKGCVPDFENCPGTSSGTSSTSSTLTLTPTISSLGLGSKICIDCQNPSNLNELESPEDLCNGCSRKRLERKEIIMEIYETEMKYGRDLRIIKDEFYAPIQVAGLLTKEQLDQIFLNVDHLIYINGLLTDKLREAVHSNSNDDHFLEVNVGKIFVEIGEDMMTAFESYCTRQANAGSLLNQLEKEKELLRIFLRVSQIENAVLRRMNLPAFLMVPVQRVTRYPLLLSRLLKATPLEHFSRNEIQAAHERIELHLEHMNKVLLETTRDVSSVKLWRKISIMNGSNTALHRRSNSDVDGINMKIRKFAVEMLDWAHFSDVTCVVDNQFSIVYNNGKPARNVYGCLMARGKDLESLATKMEKEMFFPPAEDVVKDVKLVLVRIKNSRLSLLKEPLCLAKCVVSQGENEFQDFIEINEITSKNTYYLQGLDKQGTSMWLRLLQCHAQCVGQWRKRRGALANIMMNGMIRNVS